MLCACICTYVCMCWRWTCTITMPVQCQKTKHLKCKGKGFLMQGTSNVIHCRKSCLAGQNSGVKRGHMRVVRPVLDRGECWSHPTPTPGILQKQEIQNSRKDPFFHQIPGCNLAPSEQGVERERRKATAKLSQFRVEKQNADTDACFGIWKEFGELVLVKLCSKFHCSV